MKINKQNVLAVVLENRHRYIVNDALDKYAENPENFKRDVYAFWGGPCSQWASLGFAYHGLRFPTAEHWMMYHKAVFFNNLDAAKEILDNRDPAEVKAIGRKITGFVKEEWEPAANEYVLQAQLLKAIDNPGYKDFLLSLPGYIVEGSPTDNVWGVKIHCDDEACKNPNLWQGTNFLGFRCMDARDLIIKYGIE